MHYKCLTVLSMLYMTIKLITIILIYKIIAIGPLSASASTLIIPFWFFLSDIITEVYGYDISKQIIWTAIICQFIFAFICAGLISLHSPPLWPYQSAYDQVAGKLPRVALASFFAITIAAFINAYILTKWKILLRGKYFWLRSLGATAIGELIFTVIAYLTEFLGTTSLSTLSQLMAISYSIKLLASPILVIPSALIATWIKKVEGFEIHNDSINLSTIRKKLITGESY